MTDEWIEDLRAETIDTNPRPGFKDELLGAMVAEWRSGAAPSQPAGRRRQWWAIGAAAACVALLVGGLVAFSQNDQTITPSTVPEATAVTTPSTITEVPTTTPTAVTVPVETVVTDVVVSDPLNISLDDWIDPTVTPSADAEIVVIDQGTLTDTLVVSDEAGALYAQPPGDTLGYSYTALVTTDDQAEFDITLDRDMLGDPCGLLEFQNPGTVGDLTGATLGESVCGPTDDGSTLSVAPAAGSGSTSSWSALEIAQALTFVTANEVPHPDLTATTGDDEPDNVDFAGTLSGLRWAITAGATGTRPMFSYVGGNQLAGFELSQAGLSAGQQTPIIDSTIDGVPGYGALAYGHVEGDAVAVLVTSDGQQTARLPMIPSDGRSAFAVPIADTVDIATLTFIADDGSTIAIADVPDIPAGLGGGGVIRLAPRPAEQSPPMPRAFVDEDNNRCLEYTTSATSASGVCFDDGYDELEIRTVDAGTHSPNATVIGATDNIEAARIVVVSDTGEQPVELLVVDGWPERIFAANLPGGNVVLRLEASDGRILATATP